jgi:hypothetical protein
MPRPSCRRENFPPPTRAARSEVVAIAKRYLGAPYQWGASGPNSFDCSGFTIVRLSPGRRLASALLASPVRRRARRCRAAPCNRATSSSSAAPIHHVGIYVGGGQYIHSPRTGDVVKISPRFRRAPTTWEPRSSVSVPGAARLRRPTARVSQPLSGTLCCVAHLSTVGARGDDVWLRSTDLLQLMTEKGSSDLHVKAGSPPAIRLNGKSGRHAGVPAAQCRGHEASSQPE